VIEINGVWYYEQDGELLELTDQQMCNEGLVCGCE
jgi:hypothetical protein